MKLLNSLFTVQQAQEGRAEIALHADHPIYRAHFPERPVTPGVVQVQIVGELLEQQFGQELELRKVTNLKFIRPITPQETPEVEVNYTFADGKAKGTIAAGDEVLTKFSLVFQRKVNPLKQ